MTWISGARLGALNNPGDRSPVQIPVNVEPPAVAPTAIKKYANRRLYHTGTSTYVTLEDLAQMIQKGEDFLVQDARTGEDITRAVLTQIIVEQEAKGTNLLPIAFLRQLIRFYGDSLQAVVPSYLDASMQQFASQQHTFRDQMTNAFAPGAAFQAMQDSARRNMAVFEEAMRMFTPFVATGAAGGKPPEAAPAAAGSSPPSAEVEALRRELGEMQRRVEALAGKP